MAALGAGLPQLRAAAVACLGLSAQDAVNKASSALVTTALQLLDPSRPTQPCSQPVHNPGEGVATTSHQSPVHHAPALGALWLGHHVTSSSPACVPATPCAKAVSAAPVRLPQHATQHCSVQYATSTPGSSLLRYSQAIAQCDSLNQLLSLWRDHRAHMRCSHMAALSLRAVELQNQNKHPGMHTQRAVGTVRGLLADIIKQIQISQCTVEDLQALLGSWHATGFYPRRDVLDQVVHRLKLPRWAMERGSVAASELGAVDEPGGKLRAASLEGLAVLVPCLRAVGALEQDEDLALSVVTQVCRRAPGYSGSVQAIAKLTHELVTISWTDPQVYQVLAQSARHVLTQGRPGDVTWLLHSLSRAGCVNQELLTDVAEMVAADPTPYVPHAARLVTVFAVAHLPHQLMLDALGSAVAQVYTTWRDAAVRTPGHKKLQAVARKSVAAGTPSVGLDLDLVTCGQLAAAYAHFECLHKPLFNAICNSASLHLHLHSHQVQKATSAPPSSPPCPPAAASGISPIHADSATQAGGDHNNSHPSGDQNMAAAAVMDVAQAADAAHLDQTSKRSSLVSKDEAQSFLLSVAQLARCTMVQGQDMIRDGAQPAVRRNMLTNASDCLARLPPEHWHDRDSWQLLGLFLEGLMLHQEAPESALVLAQQLAQQLLQHCSQSESAAAHDSEEQVADRALVLTLLRLVKFEAQYMHQRRTAAHKQQQRKGRGVLPPAPAAIVTDTPSTPAQVATDSFDSWPVQGWDAVMDGAAWETALDFLHARLQHLSNGELCQLLGCLAVLGDLTGKAWPLVQACLVRLHAAKVFKSHAFGKTLWGDDGSANTGRDTVATTQLLSPSQLRLDMYPGAEDVLQEEDLAALYHAFLIAQLGNLEDAFVPTPHSKFVIKRARAAWNKLQHATKTHSQYSTELWRELHAVNIPVQDAKEHPHLADCPVPITTLVWDSSRLVSVDILDKRQFDVEGQPLASVLFKRQILAAYGVRHAVIHRAAWDDPNTALPRAAGWALNRASCIHKALRDARRDM